MLPQCLTRHSQSARSRVHTLLRRAYATNRGVLLKAEDLTISTNEDRDAIVHQTIRLVDHGRWQICNNGSGLERMFKFKSFKATWDFMNHVAEECKRQKHHPEWSNVYNKTHVRWTTHNPVGLSSRDLRMAEFCDQASQTFGELLVDPSECKYSPDGKIEPGDCCNTR